jgi:hypothetical protein
MVENVSRDPLHTVTMPIVISAGREAADGWTTLIGPNRTGFAAVRVVKLHEIQRRLKELFRGKESLLFAGAATLPLAYELKDEQVLQQSLERVHSWIPLYGAGPRPTKRPADEGVRWLYSSLMTNLLQAARLVMWCSDKRGRFLPGVYCPDWKTAAFVTLFMNHLRVCPKCGAPFTPNRETQNYCTPAHGVAHRTARSRWRARQRAARKS